MAKRVDAAKAAAAYQRGMAQAASAYKDGIQSVTESPMAAAATPAASARYMEGIQRSEASGKRVAKLQATPLQTWKDNAVNVGANRLATGAQKAAGKVQAHHQKWAPVYQAASDAAAAVTGPKGLATAMAKQQAALTVLMQAAGST